MLTQPDSLWAGLLKRKYGSPFANTKWNWGMSTHGGALYIEQRHLEIVGQRKKS